MSWVDDNGNAVVTLVTGMDSSGYHWYPFPIWITSFSTANSTQFADLQMRNGISRVPIRRAEQLIQFTVDWPFASTQRDPVMTSSNINVNSGQQINYNGFYAMNQFNNALITHQQIAAQAMGTTPPMDFLFYNGTEPNVNPVTGSGMPASNPLVSNNMTRINTPLDNITLQPLHYQGWVLATNKVYDRFLAVYSQQYSMNVLTPQGSPVNTGNANNPLSLVTSYISNSGTLSSLIPKPATVLGNSNSVANPTYGWTRGQVPYSDGIDISQIPG